MAKRALLLSCALAGAAAIAQSPGKPVPVTVDNFPRATLPDGSWNFPKAQPVI